MVFSSYVFLFLFLPVVCIVYFMLPFHAKNLWLLLASLFFYGWNSPKYLLILLSSIAINYLTGWFIEKENHHKKINLIIGIIANLGLLVYFKYANFIVQNISHFVPELAKGWTAVVLPLGISFFTFQGMSYIIDVYRGDAPALNNPLDVALYISLFPQLVAGPIVRFSSISNQIRSRRINSDSIGYGFRRFVFGLAKKMLLADVFGLIADGVFANPNSWDMGTAWIGIMAYTLQIYYDFSGYSDMAIGLGAVFGFRLEENFSYPLTATSVTEFWRRWHISLTTWFRDYVYIPLGGNRVSVRKHVINILVVWILTGIWHGAEWSFIVWGIYYGVLLIIEKYLVKRVPVKAVLIRWLITIILVMIGFVLFRAETLPLAGQYLKAMFSLPPTHKGTIIFMRRLTNYAVFWIAGFIGIFPVSRKIRDVAEQNNIQESVFYAIAVNVYTGVLLILTVYFLFANSYNTFIYFRF